MPEQTCINEAQTVQPIFDPQFNIMKRGRVGYIHLTYYIMSHR